MEEAKKVFMNLNAWSVVNIETAGKVSSGKVKLEIGLRWICGRDAFFGSCFALFVHAVDPDDGSSPRCDLS